MKKHIPNTLTCCNLVSGCIAVVAALHGEFPLALLMIIIGAVFDFFDGMVARMLHVSSPIGKELDSLADVVTFGVAPSMMLFAYLAESFQIGSPDIAMIFRGEGNDRWLALLSFLPLIMAAFSALRLAKFNLDERQSMGFIGFPTPANALFWGAVIVSLQHHAIFFSGIQYVLLVGMLISSYLLVSEIPMFALKFKHWGWKGNEIKYFFLLTSVLLIVFLGVAGIAAVIAWYVVLSIVTALYNK